MFKLNLPAKMIIDGDLGISVFFTSVRVNKYYCHFYDNDRLISIVQSENIEPESLEYLNKIKEL